DPRQIGILPPQSLFSRVWEPMWAKICFVLIAKSGLIALIGLFSPETVLWVMNRRGDLRKTIGPVAAGLTPFWAILFTPDFPTKGWLQRRALHRAAQRQPERALEIFSKHYLLKAPRVSTPVLTPHSGDDDKAISRDQLITAMSQSEAFLIVIS